MKFPKLTSAILALVTVSGSFAQDLDFKNFFNKTNLNPDLSLSVEAGSTGIGFGVESRLNKRIRLRTGFDWMPKFKLPLHFNIQVGEDGDPGYDSEGRSRFDRMSAYLEDMTGFKIDQEVDMIAEPSFHNFKLLVDVYPFRNDHWYFTTGFYVGPSVIGKAYNRTEEMTTLISVSMYNNIYNKVYDLEYNDESEYDGVFLGMELPPYVNSRILEAGRMGMHIGDFKDGTPYMMEPDEDNMVKAKMKVNSFRPYLGAGFNGLIDRKNERLKFAADCGVMFWGGSPKVYAQPGTDQETEITTLNNLNGQVSKYIDISNKFKVFPIINISISYRLF
ncbi:MAG: hypothetical protein IK006_06825 [Bacteroidaceae bacterium]|nr:hypothetical protein [Bacteroidaceae bacterium]